ncbi:MAG: transposase [Bacteroidetes bacterium]|jgi:transposase|nr:transposase [Bacteroidota bacterium]
MKKKTLGIDVSKDKLDFCTLQDLKQGVLERGVTANDQKSISKWLDSIDLENTVIAMEHTGHYSAMLAWLLSERNAFFYMINPLELKRSMGMQRGKSDAVDAYRIASYTIRNYDRLEPFKLPTEKLRKLKALMCARRRYVKIATQLKNANKANLILNKTIDIKDIIRQEKKHIRSIEKSKKQLERQMIDIIKSTEDLKKPIKK